MVQEEVDSVLEEDSAVDGPLAVPLQDQHGGEAHRRALLEVRVDSEGPSSLAEQVLESAHAVVQLPAPGQQQLVEESIR